MNAKHDRISGVEILIAEDSRTQAEQLQALLEAHGYTVRAAADGEQALDLARRRKPDLIISDVLMPRLDGYGLCKAIKSDAALKDVPVILVTTLSDPQDVIKGLECGADNFIRKPFDERYLLSRIDYLLMNLELRKNQKMHLGLEIHLGSQRHFITAERQQILDLLISTYEQAVRVNSELLLREKELAYSNRVLQGLHRIAEGLNQAASERDVAETALERALELPGVQAGWISLRAGETDFRVAAARNLPPALSGPDGLSGSCACRRKLLSGELDGVANILECERLAKAQGDTRGLRCHASVPLWLGAGRVIGVLNLAGPGEGMFDQDALQMLYGVGHQVAVALERARLHEHLEQLVEQRTAALTAEIAERKRAEHRIARLNRVHAVLSGINSLIVRERDRNTLFQRACRIAVEQGGFVFAWIGTFEADTGRVAPVAGAGHDDGYLELIARSETSDDGTCPLIVEARDRATPSVCNDIAADPRMHAWHGPAGDRGYRSAAMLPLIVDGRPVAVCALYAPETGVFDEEELRLLTELAGDLSFALEYIEKSERLNYLAYYDVVTGLPNREMLGIQLEWAMAEAARHAHLIGVAFLDLDRFKIINDSLGRGAGDRLLIAVAERLRRSVREGDTVVRLSGDEFALILTNLPNPDTAARVAQQVIDCFAKPFHVDGHELFTSASLGLTLHMPGGGAGEDLLRNAEIAMSRAKDAGGNAYQFHLAEMTSRAHERLALENALRHALDREELLLHYQPVVDLKDGRIQGVEALVRWRHPQRGLVSPAEFIPLAEETGLIVRLGEWVLRTACKDGRAHAASKTLPVHMAVNVSPRQFEKPDFSRIVAAAIEDSGYDPSRLHLEITESLLMQNADGALAAMRDLGKLGVQFSIDDFGTGYSSLAYLKSLPIGSLKIDRAFVRELPGNSSDAALVKAMISMAHGLGMRVVAEGVETKEQLAFLRAHGCDQGQGYLFSRPLPADEVAALIAAGGVLDLA